MKVLVAMSGGVDSSVAAKLLSDEGYECVGCTMRLYENDMIGLDLFETCCSLKDTEDARKVTEKIGIPYHIFHYENLFREKVIEPFVNSYENGKTPNPCIECNRVMKFKYLFEKADALGCDYLATGHYGIVEYDEEKQRYLLKKAKDPNKDQSYVLYTLTQDQLSRLKLPLGGFCKNETRDIAETSGFVNSKKHDSQDICFIPDGDYASFIRNYRKKEYPEGDFVDENGNVLGRHKGIIFYTIGQRKGLNISSSAPLYVTDIDPVTNTVHLSHGENLFKTELKANSINLISVPKIEGEMRACAKIRYRHKEAPCTVIQTGEDELTVRFDEPQRAITKGQSVVIYDGDIVVGGGTII